MLNAEKLQNCEFFVAKMLDSTSTVQFTFCHFHQLHTVGIDTNTIIFEEIGTINNHGEHMQLLSVLI